MAAHHRHVAGIVENPVLLLVGRVVFFIDDDQPQFLEGQEKRRPCARHNPHGPFRDLPPDTLAGARRKVGMPFSGLCPEPVMETVEKLLGQRDFGQENQHLPALLDRLGDRFEINFRFARTGHAVEKRNRETASFNRFRQHFSRRLLVFRKRGARIVDIRPCHHGWRRQHDFLENALRLQPVHDRHRDARRMGKPGSGPGKPVAGKFHHARPRFGHTLRLTAGITKARHRWLGIECGRHAQDHARHHAGRRQRVVRCPAHEAQHVGAHRRTIEDLGNFPQFSGIDRIGFTLADDPRHLTRSKRHAHDRSGLDVHTRRNHI